VEVNWLPFQLNANASKAGVNKMEMYMSKFGKSKEEVVQMSQFMKGNFDRAGLPYKFTDQSLTGNTFNSHRLIAYAGSLGPDVQDKLVEALFHAYFAEEKFLNDQSVLLDAALEAGLREDVARRIVEDEQEFAAETQEEMQIGKRLCVTGVPYFVLSNAEGQEMQVSGAQPPEQFEAAIKRLSSKGNRIC